MMNDFLEPYKDYITAFIFSLFGGIAGYIMRKGQVRSFSEFSCEMILGVFAGIMMFLAVHDSQFDEHTKYLLVSGAAMGGRETLLIFQKIYRRKIGGGKTDADS